MPQLNPSPWLTILSITWLAYLTILPFKILYYTFPNEPTQMFLKDPALQPWNWPWF